MTRSNKMNSTSLTIAITVLVATATGVYWQVNHTVKEDHSQHLETKDMTEKKMTYVCPMHPHITSDKPGQSCPICGMKLVLAEESGAHKGHSMKEHEKVTKEIKTPDSHVQVHLSAEKQQMIGVKLGHAKKEALFKTINAPGRIAFDPELYTAQSEYLEALRQGKSVKDSPLADVRKSTNEMIRSAKIRLKVLGLSNDQIQSLTKKGSQSEGLLVSGKGQESWVYADVFEVDLPQITKGLSAEITANFLQGKKLVGKVISVDQVINRETRTAKVRIQLQDLDSNIRPESYVSVKIYAPQGEHLAVPIDALMDTGRDTFVFVKSAEGEFEPRRVTVVLETDDKVAIVGAISEDDEVVVGGNFMLDSESRLKAVLRGTTKPAGHNH